MKFKIKLSLKRLPFKSIFFMVLKLHLWLILIISKAFHVTLLPTTLNPPLFIRWRCHNIEGVIGRHVKMWFKTNASRRGGNKELWNWISNSKLWCMKSWIGWTLIFIRGIGTKCLREWTCHVAIKFLDKLSNLHTKCGNWPHQQQEALPKIKILTPIVKKDPHHFQAITLTPFTAHKWKGRNKDCNSNI